MHPGRGVTPPVWAKEDMEITKDESGHLLTLAGRLDIRGADELRQALRDFTSGGADSVIDLSGVEGCDTAALQLIHSTRLTVENAGRRFELAGLSAAVREASAALGLALAPQTGETEDVT